MFPLQQKIHMCKTIESNEGSSFATLQGTVTVLVFLVWNGSSSRAGFGEMGQFYSAGRESSNEQKKQAAAINCDSCILKGEKQLL